MKQVKLKTKLIDFLLELAEMGESKGERKPFFDAANEVNQGGVVFQSPHILASKAYRLYRHIGCSDEIATANCHLLSKQLLAWGKQFKKIA